MFAYELHRLLGRKEISTVELLQSVHNRIDQVEQRIKAYLFIDRDHALANAKRAQEQIDEGRIMPLSGIPVLIKDNICQAGAPCTCGSRILENFYPPYDSTVVERLRSAGAVFLGKANMDEFAMGSSTENSVFGPTRNPWDLGRVPGGSSGGSAAAVAAGECIVALGSDTGGSIRQPAAFCGTTGVKPTYGLVSRFGLVAYASSLDQIGPITRNVRDAAAVLRCIGGHDPRDSSSAPDELPDFERFLASGIRGMRIGLPVEFFGEGLDPVIREIVEGALIHLEDLGAKILEVSLPHIKYALPAYYIIAPAEASSNLARYDGARYGYRAKDAGDVVTMFKRTRGRGFGPEVKRRIMIGTYALSSGYYEAYYLKAQRARTLIKQDFAMAFESCSCLVTPATPTLPFKIGEKTDDPLKMYLSDIYTVAVNLAGIPALVIPCGFAEGLPVGMQILGPEFSEKILFQVAFSFQESTDFHRRRPNLEEVAGGFRNCHRP